MKNPAFLDKKSPYHTQANEFPISLIPDGTNVIMDLGCSSGWIGQNLLEMNKAAEVVGVEIFEPAAQEAMKCYKAVHVGNIEVLTLDYSSYFDVVICGDILEHLKEPFSTIRKIYCWLKDGELIVCSVPNVRYWRVWRDLVFRGVWQYTSEGILDQTHLRFFTTRSFKKMLTEACFAIQYEGMRIAVGLKQQAFNRLTFGLFEEFLGFQILISAQKT